MAKDSKNKQKLNYAEELSRLRQSGPRRLYLLWGPEDYLREQYIVQLKKLCIPDGDDGFSYKRFNGPKLDAKQLAQAVDAMPFMTERSLVELRDIDLNKLEDPEAVLAVLNDIPDYCTVVLAQDTLFEPDGRLKFIKGLRETAKELYFSEQTQDKLTDWIARRFSALGKSIDMAAAQRLIFVSGELMNRLIPEIEKIAAYAKGQRVTVDDVDAVANHIPEAVVFEMTEYMAQKKYNSAISELAELLSDMSKGKDKNNEPIVILAVLAAQMRKLYAAKLALEDGMSKKSFMELCGIKQEFVATKLLNAARGFSMPGLIRAVELCTLTDYRMKSSGGDAKELLKEAVIRIAAGEE